MSYLSRSLRILPLALAFLSNHAASSESELKPLREYLAQNDFTKSPEVVQYVFARCSSLYIFLSVAAQGEAEYLPQSAQFGKRGDDFLTALSQTESGAEVARSQIYPLIGDYKKKFFATQDNPGGSFDDPTIQSDLSFCSTLASDLKTQ